MRKVVIGVSICFVLLALFIWNMQSEPKESEQSPIVSIEQKKPVTKKNTDPNQVTWTVEQYGEVAVKYVQVSKSGMSTDSYTDRLKSLKDSLSEELYKKLVPADETPSSEPVSPERIAETSVIDVEYACRQLSESSYEVYVVYTLGTMRNGSQNVARYLTRMVVNSDGENCIISSILEDSELGNGLYSNN